MFMQGNNKVNVTTITIQSAAIVNIILKRNKLRNTYKALNSTIGSPIISNINIVRFKK